MEQKNYRAALVYFDLVAAGATNPGFAHYQRARAYAMLANTKGALTELRLALDGGFHEVSALGGGEFQALNGLGEFQALAAEWKAAEEKEKEKP
jgi:hypothetical protein